MLETLFVGGALNFLAAVLILMVGWMVAQYASRWVLNALSHVRVIDATLNPLIASTLKYGILAITIMAVLERFGVQTTSIIAVLGAAGLAIGLALQGTLSNVASGVMLLLLRPIRVREKVSLPGSAGIVGVVREVGLFRTVLIADNGEYLSVPNSMIFSTAIVNESREPTRRVYFMFDVDRTANIGRVQSIVRDVLHKDPRILKNPLPDIVVDSTTDNGISFAVMAWVLNPNFGPVKSDLQRAVRESLITAKIPLPQQAMVLSGSLQSTQAEESDMQRRQRSA